MTNIKELRRLAQAATPGPDGVSLNWLKLLQDFQKEANPAAINELLSRFEAAEKDIILKEKIIDSIGSILTKVVNERDELRANVEAMEKQEPVAWARKLGLDVPSFGCVTDLKYRPSNIPESSYTPLYLAPGAQPAPIEQDTSVRKAWARFSNELHRSPDAPYPGMADAFERHFSQSFTDREWRTESATWAAAWKAAKRHEAQARPAPSVSDSCLAGVKAVADMIQKKADDYANEHGYDDMGGLSFGPGMKGEIKMDYYTNLLELVDEVKSMLAAAPEPKSCP